MYIAISPDGRLAPIGSVARGLACGCTCVSCGEHVVARQGDVREWHYAHVSNREPCAINGETVIHLLVKQFILDAGGLKVPQRPAGRLLAPPLEASIGSDGWLRFERVEIEVNLGSVRLDLVGYVGDAQMAIEVGYTSFCDLPKLAQFEHMGLSALEIDVGGFDPHAYDECAMRLAVLTQLERMKWLFCSEVELVPVAGPEDAPARSAGYSAPQADLPKSFFVAGRYVVIKRLPYGDLAVWYDYSEMVCRLVREQIAHRFNGKWNRKYKNWLFRSCWERSILDELSRLSQELA